MTILQLQRRLMEAGRIRIGQQVPTKSGKTRPEKLSTFRLTSRDKRRIEAAAQLYGGTPKPWQAPDGDQWEVITQRDALDVIVPPSEMCFSQSFELWSGGGCQRRCDGVTEQITDSPCLCDPDAPECKPHTRLSVMLADLSGLGVWRLDSTGWNSAFELAAAVEIIRTAGANGVLLPARLRLEQRRQVSGGETRRFAVPVLDVDITPAQLLGGVTPTRALPAAPASEPASGVRAIPAGSAASVREQLEAIETPKPRKSRAQPIPRTGIKPRTVAEREKPGETSPEIGEGVMSSPSPEAAAGAAADPPSRRDAPIPTGVSTPPSPPPDEPPPSPAPDETSEPLLTAAQHKKLFAVCHELNLDDDARYDKAGGSFARLTKNEARRLIDELENGDLTPWPAVMSHVERNSLARALRAAEPDKDAANELFTVLSQLVAEGRVWGLLSLPDLRAMRIKLDELETAESTGVQETFG